MTMEGGDWFLSEPISGCTRLRERDGLMYKVDESGHQHFGVKFHAYPAELAREYGYKIIPITDLNND